MAVAVLIMAAFAIVAGSGDLRCNKPNEEARKVAECPPQKTCRTRDLEVSCLQSAAENLKNRCVCKDGYYRNSVGECVSDEDCDKCLGQNEYFSLQLKSDQSCSDLEDKPVKADKTDNTVSNESASGISSQCLCDPGSARDENNVCVPYDQCNQPCGAEEVKDYCPADCLYDYCPKKDLRSVTCPQPTLCPKPQCKCRFNYRRSDNGSCIPTRDCPPFECKKPFEVYNPCPPLCPNGSCGQATPTGRCPAIFGRIGIVLDCSPQCRCKKGYWWNEAKVCVPYDQCPGKSNTTGTLS